ncbi:helix-turn-helix domain-containing protein [Luteibacter sp. CQ10]|uniref:helix-turn-helix domain-containing protein n=1 Tax=Luteibacter sp. CQ10 TaxID=2805821 RepID=UPI0034A215E6
MPASKSIDQPEYQLVLDLIRAVRVEAGLSQQALTERLGRPQTYASDCELGARRMDALQLHQWCVACGTSLTNFARRLEAALSSDEKALPEKPPQRVPRRSPS